MKLCLSFAPGSMTEALTQLRQGSHVADLIEMRVDGITDLDLKKLLQKPRPQLIITNRRASEGGKFHGSAEDQHEILSSAVKLGAEYVDAEISWGVPFIRALLRRSARTKVICSYHNIHKTPKDLFRTYHRMHNTGAHILKIATTAKNITDNVIMFDILRNARKDRQQMMGICMDEAGEISRILAAKYGSYLSYAPPTSGERTAPGQIPFGDLKKIFRVHTLNRRTHVFGLVGNPVRHSRGIYFHNNRFTRSASNAVYVNFLVDDLPLFLKTFRDEISGLSITMPFKEEIVPLLDSVETDSASLRVVNTVIKRRGQLIGYNTDLSAILSIVKKRVSFRNKRVTVIGTGATAKTMAYAAVLNGARTCIVGRSEGKARSLARNLGCEWGLLESLPSFPSDILMHGTSVGMAIDATGNSYQDDKSLVPKSYFRKGMVVLDAVYHPPITKLLRDARSAGCVVVTGEELFNRQAQMQSKLFMECMG